MQSRNYTVRRSRVVLRQQEDLMAVITHKLDAKVSKKEQSEIDAILVAGIQQNSKKVAKLLQRPLVKKLLERGVLKYQPRARCDDSCW